VAGEPLPYSRNDIDDIAKHINGVVEQSDTNRREHAAGVVAMAQSRATRRGYRALGETELERVVRELGTAKGSPAPEFVEDVVRRIESRQIANKTVALLLPMVASAAVWEHVGNAICAWFVASPHDAMSIMHVSVQMPSGTGSWSTSIARVEANPDLPKLCSRSICTATLVIGGDVVQGPRCTAPGQQMAWHRATAAVLIQQLGGEVPKEWIAKDVAAQVVREVGIEPNRVPYLLSVLRERKLPNPKFSFGHEGPMHKPTFYCTCTVGDTMAEGIGENKQQAKNVAAHVMLKKLNGIAKGRTETAT
jgi:hypothetical protein